MNNALKVVPIRPDLWALDEAERTVMWLLNGSKQILLLDTGFGLSDLHKVITETCGDTNKPVYVINSHGHIDHNSGNNQFDVVHVDRFDEPDSHYEFSAEDKERVIKQFFGPFISKGGEIDNWNPGPASTIIPVSDGEIIDLGSYHLRVIESPGHSRGSIALYEPDQGWLFTGDLMLTWEVWGQLEGSTALSVYGDSINRLRSLQEHVTAVFPAHWQEDRNPLKIKSYELPPEVLSVYADGIQQILIGKYELADYPFEMYKKNYKCAFFKIGGIAFDPNRMGRIER